MTPDRWRRIDELFEAALDRDPAEREAFLDEACGDDSALRREVERLLEVDERAGDFIERPALTSAVWPRGDAESDALERTTPSHPPIDEGRFVPGTVVSGRYRIVSLLGRGGMGEVYRADDLTLRQPVALKFLPAGLSRDPLALERLFQEVRVARQIAHRNVCRVYDVGEASGHHFISMEFVRGEELSLLLKRIGRFPHDKAVEIALQLCAGLAAIHERGVLHRDLKPANVMIDEAGNVRITDFGLATAAEDVRGREAMIGTPAYMSPEQLAGERLTVRSDVYALGLVLYEVFTGRRAFSAGSIEELLSLRRSNPTPAIPVDQISDLDPLVTRAIQRCLERDPELRPGSAVEVAAALPGGDPVAAALAAGETPSPEMLAAAPAHGALRPVVAMGLLGLLLVTTALFSVLADRAMLHNRVPLPKPPAVLDERASAILTRLGRAAPPVDSAHGFALDTGYLLYVDQHDEGPPRWQRLETGEPATTFFWYRQSPDYLVPFGYEQVTPEDPPREVPGMAGVRLDTRGRLRSFYAVPAAAEAQRGPASEPDWTALFEEAGLDPSRFRRVDPSRLPPSFADARAAWEGVYPEASEVPIRVEAAALGGRPVAFEVLNPWDDVDANTVVSAETRGRVFISALIAVILVALAGGAALAVRNVRLGRGDRRGAMKVAILVFGVRMLGWAFTANHVPAAAEFLIFLYGLARSFAVAGAAWMLYVALEPFVRRRWPEHLISWSRLLSGNLRDAMIGRDVLIGLCTGSGIVVCGMLRSSASTWLGLRPEVPAIEPGGTMLGLDRFPEALSRQIEVSLLLSLIALVLVVLLSIVVRRRLPTAVAAWSIGSGLLALLGLTSHPLGLALAALSAFLVIATLYRFGLVALVAAMLVVHAHVMFPVTSRLSEWYATGFAIDLCLLVALGVYAFFTSLGGAPLVSGSFIDE